MNRTKDLCHFVQYGRFWIKTSVALATESSVYVWSRACVVKLHKDLNNEFRWYPLVLYRSFQGQNSLFYASVFTCTLFYVIVFLMFNCTVSISLETSFLTIFDTFLTNRPTNRPMRGDVEAPIMELKKCGGLKNAKIKNLSHRKSFKWYYS